jgi:hypothetical protein
MFDVDLLSLPIKSAVLVNAQTIQFVDPDFSDALWPIVDVGPLHGHVVQLDSVPFVLVHREASSSY